MNRLDCNPDDVELVRKTTPEGFGDWIAQKIEYEFAAREFLERIPAPRVLLSALLDAIAAGDTPWLRRSKQRGVLHAMRASP